MESREAQLYSIDCRVGRLIEARVFGLKTPADTEAYTNALVARIARAAQSTRAVLCADHRPVQIYTPEVAARLGELFRGMNPRLERAAILVAKSNATLLMQLDRLAREAAFPNRKVFLTPEEALAHLAGGLDMNERARAAAFLMEHGG